MPSRQTVIFQSEVDNIMLVATITGRPGSADRTARRQFQATGQPVSRTQASDAMTSRLPRYEATCVQRRCFQCGSVPLRSDIKGSELPPANILIPLERQLIAYNFAADSFYIMLIFALDKLNIRHISTSAVADWMSTIPQHMVWP